MSKSKKKQKRTSGFLKRMKTSSGKVIIRRRKGRYKLTV